MKNVITRVCCGVVFALCCMSDAWGMNAREVRGDQAAAQANFEKVWLQFWDKYLFKPLSKDIITIRKFSNENLANLDEKLVNNILSKSIKSVCGKEVNIKQIFNVIGFCETPKDEMFLMNNLMDNAKQNNLNAETFVGICCYSCLRRVADGFDPKDYRKNVIAIMSHMLHCYTSNTRVFLLGEGYYQSLDIDGPVGNIFAEVCNIINESVQDVRDGEECTMTHDQDQAELNDKGKVLVQVSEEEEEAIEEYDPFEEEEASKEYDPFQAAYAQIHNENLQTLLTDSMIRAMKPSDSTDCIENLLSTKVSSFGDFGSLEVVLTIVLNCDRRSEVIAFVKHCQSKASKKPLVVSDVFNLTEEVKAELKSPFKIAINCEVATYEALYEQTRLPDLAFIMDDAKVRALKKERLSVYMGNINDILTEVCNIINESVQSAQ